MLRFFLLYLAVLSSSLSFLSCSENNTIQVVGGGTEDGNSAVTGFATDESGKPLAKVSVYALPEGYIATEEEPIADSLRTTSDDDGEFRIKLGRNMVYNFWLEHKGSKKKLYIKKINTGLGSYELGQRILKPTGDIHLQISQNKLSHQSRIAIPGTPVAKLLDSAEVSSQSIFLSSLPIGIYDSVVYLPQGKENEEAVTLAQTLEVRENDTLWSGDLSLWKYKARITLNTSARGLNLSEDVANYPLFLHLNSLDFNFGEARNEAEDLRFADAYGKLIPFEIENWDPAGETADIWLLLDKLQAQNENQYIQMYWGNPGSPPFLFEDKVFSKEEGYFAVYHLNQEISLDENNFRDASDNENHGSASDNLGNARSEMTAFYKGVQFTEDYQFIYSNKLDSAPNNFSISLWFKTEAEQSGRIIGFSSSASENSIQRDRHIYIDSVGSIHFGVFPKISEEDYIAEEDSGYINLGDYPNLENLPSEAEDPSYPGIRRIIKSGEGYNDGSWHFVVASLSPELGARLFVDGILVDEKPDVKRGENFMGFWKLGFDYLGDWERQGVLKSSYLGMLDEVRIYYGTLSQQQIYMDYQIQKPGQSPLIISHTP